MRCDAMRCDATRPRRALPHGNEWMEANDDSHSHGTRFTLDIGEIFVASSSCEPVPDNNRTVPLVVWHDTSYRQDRCLLDLLGLETRESPFE